nr:unnamed protein product [Callosobruchus chinensis]
MAGRLEDIKTLLYNNNIDLLAISETWLNEKIETSYVTIDGYTFLRRDRGSRGGGVGLYISNSLKFKKITSSGEIEQLWVSIHTSMADIICGVVYRPPTQELVNFLDQLEVSFVKALGCSEHVFCLDVHAPYKLVRFTKKPAPWLTDNLRFIMHLRDAAKAKFNQTKSVESWEKYKKAKNFATQAVRNEKKAFFNHLCKCKDRKQIWKQLQNLNIRKTEQTGVIPDQLRDADSVNEYFINSVPSVSHDDKDFLQYLNNTVYNRVKENDFRFVLATEEDIFNIIRDSIKTDAVGVDGINISIIKICYPVIKGALINIVNSCILSGYYPRAWKTAVENIDKIKIEVNGTTLEVADEAKNLGVTIDSKFRYKTHVAQCIRKAYNNLRQLYPNRHILSAQLKAQLCNSIVLSHFTHALRVYAPAIDNSDQYKIQKVQNYVLDSYLVFENFNPFRILYSKYAG